MAGANAYTQFQSLVLDGESAYEELYSRLARWTEEADRFYKVSSTTEADYCLERCIELVGYMDRCLDLSGTPGVVKAILSLHRFLIGALVRAKAEHGSDELAKLVPVFMSLGEIFATIRAKRMAN
jgi:flagellin-specific chaperone FliS